MPPASQTTPTGLQWNKVTWYSKLGAIILFLGIVPALCFYIGMQYAEVEKDSTLPVHVQELSTQKSGVTTAIDDTFWKDTTHVYFVSVSGNDPEVRLFATTTVPNADPSTFKRVGDLLHFRSPEGGTTYGYYSDKNQVYFYRYYNGLAGETVEVKVMPGADAKTFHMLKPTSGDPSDAEDATQKYKFGDVSNY